MTKEYQEWADDVMTQVQVYACAWANYTRTFAVGKAFNDYAAARNELRNMVLAKFAQLRQELAKASEAASNNFAAIEIVTNYLIEIDALILNNEGDGEAVGMNLVESIKAIKSGLQAMTQDEIIEIAKQNLFSHMMQEHGITLLGSEITDIVELCKKIIQSQAQPTPSQSVDERAGFEFKLKIVIDNLAVSEKLNKYAMASIMTIFDTVIKTGQLTKTQPTSQDALEPDECIAYINKLESHVWQLCDEIKNNGGLAMGGRDYKDALASRHASLIKKDS